MKFKAWEFVCKIWNIVENFLFNKDKKSLLKGQIFGNDNICKELCNGVVANRLLSWDYVASLIQEEKTQLHFFNNRCNYPENEEYNNWKFFIFWIKRTNLCIFVPFEMYDRNEDYNKLEVLYNLCGLNCRTSTPESRAGLYLGLTPVRFVGAYDTGAKGDKEYSYEETVLYELLPKDREVAADFFRNEEEMDLYYSPTTTLKDSFKMRMNYSWDDMYYKRLAVVYSPSDIVEAYSRDAWTY